MTTGHGLPTGGYSADNSDPAPSFATNSELGSPWRTGIATGVGSLPGADPQTAAAMVADELPDLPHLAELPGRGAGADIIGRSAALLVDIAAEVVPSGWRLARRPGRDIRRAKDFLSWDIDAAEQHYAGADWVKVQIAGPWTLAAQVETPTGNRALLDHGAVNDLAASLTEGLLAHVTEMRKRLPGTGIVVQVDEPSLPAVLAGSLPTASGFGTVSAVDPIRARDLLIDLVQALDDVPTVAHSCHPDTPLTLLREAGFGALSVDLTAIGTRAARIDPIGEAVEAGTVLLAGVIPTTEPAGRAGSGGGAVPGRLGGAGDEERGTTTGEPATGTRRWAAPVLDLWNRLGLASATLGGVVVTPTCGLAGASAAWAVRAMKLSRDVANLLADQSGT